MLFGEGTTANNYSGGGGAGGGGYSNASANNNWRPAAGAHNDIGPNDSKLNKWTMPRNQDSMNGYSKPVFNNEMSSSPFWPPDSAFHPDPMGLPAHGGHMDGPFGGKMDFPGSDFKRAPNAFQPNQSFSGNEQGGPVNWGRVEINQSTPWDVGGVSGANNASAHQWNSHNKWDVGSQKTESSDYANGPIKPTMNQYFGGGAAANNFVPQQMFGGDPMSNPLPMGGMPPHYSNQQQQQLWMNQGGGGMDQFGRGGGNENHRGFNNPPFNPPPPLGHYHAPMGMIHPPMHHPMMPQQPNFRPLQQNHHVNPPPGIGGVMHTHLMSAFHHTMPPNHHQQQNASEDSVWQDPDGTLKKWQRDTGTALWGDPAKHNEQTIQRWQQFSEEEEEEMRQQQQQQSSSMDSPSSPKSTQTSKNLGWGDAPSGEDKSKSSIDAWKPNEGKDFANQRRNNSFQPSLEGLQQNEWEPSASSIVFPVQSALSTVPKHQSLPKVSLAEELSAMGLEDISGRAPIKTEVGASLW